MEVNQIESFSPKKMSEAEPLSLISLLLISNLRLTATMHLGLSSICWC